MLIVKHIQNNTVYIMQELHLQLFAFSARVVIAGFSSSTVSVHSSIFSTLINLSIKLFLHLQFS